MVKDKYKHKNTLLSKEQSLALLKIERRAFYDKIVSVECPMLENAEVYFTAQGFNHLINESNSKQGDSNARKPTEQYMKLMHLEHAAFIIKNCEDIAEIRPVKKKKKGKWKKGFHYELTCEIKDIGKVSVVIEKIGDGKHKFLSVFPLYKRPKTKKRPLRRS